MTDTTEGRLRLHLRSWLGVWPGPPGIEVGGIQVVGIQVVGIQVVGIQVVGSVRREQPGWDGRIFPLIGVGAPDSMVISVPPGQAPAVEKYVRRLAPAPLDTRLSELLPALPGLLGRPEQHVYRGVFRWCERPADLPDAGVWVDADDRVPPWLRPFGHQVLIAWHPTTGEYLGGVGIKHHDRYGKELAVGTEPAARNRGLARRLVAQAARHILDEGGVPTYQHDPANIASARVAEAAGFPDRGWCSLGLG